MKATLLLLIFVLAGSAAAQTPPVQTIYSNDSRDPWNQIFSCLYTRTVRVRLGGDLLGNPPFNTIPMMSFREAYPISARPVDRFEPGDRAIAPLYPSVITDDGLKQVLEGPLHGPDPGRSTPVAVLNPVLNEHARDVARRKMDRPDFMSLLRLWQ